MGGLKEWFKQDWVDIGSKKKGGVARGCGAVLSNRRKKTKMY